jgi:beta-carotene/zeaxanthin 4-ketolase
VACYINLKRGLRAFPEAPEAMAVSPVQPIPTALSTRRQTITGLSLATAIAVSWLAIHVYGIFGVDLATTQPLLIGGMIALECWLSVGLFIVAHDAMHGSLAPFQPRLNWWVGQACLGLYAGFRFTPLNREHHQHHRHSGTAEDPDFDARPPHGFWRWYLNFMTHYFGPREFVILTALVGTYVAVLGAPMPNLLLFWAAPALLSSLQLFTFGTYLPHRPGVDVFTDRHRARSNDLPVWLSLLTCFHFGYHHEHHDRPSAPWWRLPAERAAARGSHA